MEATESCLATKIHKSLKYINGGSWLICAADSHLLGPWYIAVKAGDRNDVDAAGWFQQSDVDPKDEQLHSMTMLRCDGSALRSVLGVGLVLEQLLPSCAVVLMS